METTEKQRILGDELVGFYLKQKNLINIWTYLFKELNKSRDQIVKMCEIEGKIEFCRGVSEVLSEGLHQIKMIERKIKIEHTTENDKKPKVWEIPIQ